jgi:outer membrane protein assembly factor BamB
MCVTLARAADWPAWLGPDRNGVSKETGLLKSWPKEGPKLLWTYKIAGEGFSSCAVVGNTYYTLGTRGGDEIVIALDADKGAELWTARIGTIFPAEANYGHGPRSTPTIDGDRLYALGSQGDLICLDIPSKGKKEIWRNNLPKDFGGVMMTGWGFSESPLVNGDMLICTPGGAKGTLAALNKADGSLIWQSAELTNKAPYSSIMPATILGVKQYIQNSFKKDTGGFISGVSAKDGKLLWSAPIFKGDSYDISLTPIVRDNLVYCSTNNTITGCHLFAIGKDLSVNDLYSKSVQKKTMKNHIGGLVLIGDYLYGYGDNIGWACQDFKKGDLKWEQAEELKGRSGAITAADGFLYVLTDSGEVGLIEATPDKFNCTGSFRLPEKSNIPRTVPTSLKSGVWAHPVVANGRLYVRDHDLIFCFDVRR